jgi:hypothetical protein
MRIRRLFDDKDLRRARFRNPDLPHGVSHPWKTAGPPPGDDKLTLYQPFDVPATMGGAGLAEA